ncbi:site-2 protease family protein [Aquisalibacillus elongatus]|uniref:Sporulation factor SpoIVFB n=1 Tax=Aquisalibacillus elongatus TaxID=485577 RepID=A0A3N5C096_9BACI|nr:site-2 protease family protein [Aquisalibacillus elongatus]RPF55478.1 sporulation factor SpoIVFB [Aquisalibacillus elongatus]
MFQNKIIQVHPLLLLLLVASYFLGMFIELISFFIIISIHELGHYAAARYYKWNITRLMIWPFGGVMETEDFYTRPNREEFMVTIAGPIQHIWIYIVLWIISMNGFEHVLLDRLFWINTIILLFNLIPIMPLDGGKLVFIGLNKMVSFHQSLICMSLFSMVIIVLINIGLLSINWTSIHLLFLSVFLVFDNWLLWKNKHIILLKHLLARYLVRQEHMSEIELLKAQPKARINDIVKHFKKDHYHYIYVNDKRTPISEEDCLRALFTYQQPHLTISKLSSKGA